MTESNDDRIFREASEQRWEPAAAVDHQLDQVFAAAARHANDDAGRVPRKLNGHLIRNLHQRLAHFEHVIAAAVADDRLDTRIVSKVARAAAESRIAEGELIGLLSNMDHANNRGAYFVAGAKRMFDRARLSWMTEEWDA